MPTNYSGLATATQSPSPPPSPAVVPTVVLPLAGDGDTAASVTQAFKVLADFVAWLMNMRAKVSDWVTAIFVVRNARLLRRGGYDHLGFPGGQLLQWCEDWADTGMPGGGTPYSGVSGGSGFFGRKFQAFVSNSTGSSLAFSTVGNNPPMATPLGPQFMPVSNLKLECEFTPGQTNVVGIHTAPAQGTTAGAVSLAIFDENFDVAIEWMIESMAIASSDELVMGVLSDPTITSTTGRITDQNIPGFLVALRAGDTHWQVFSCPDGYTRTVTDTGIGYTSNAITRFRMELRGANTCDDSTPRVFLYINGVPAPSGGIVMSTAGFNVTFFMRTMVNAAGSNVFYLGPVRFCCNLFPGDVF